MSAFRQSYQYGVRPTADRLVFEVDSDRPGTKPYRVDFEQFGGFGACDCPDFRFAKGGGKSKLERVRAGDRSEAATCKHMRRAAWAAKDMFVGKVLEHVNAKKPRHQSEAHSNSV